MHVHDMFDRTLLRGMLGQGYVRERRHPTLPLAIFNYAEKAAYERVWNEVTRACRGLIVADDGQVVARPWTKFFNYGQPEAGELDLNAPVEVTDKLDGSLGVLYPTLGGHAVATRGSFTSDQAIHATAVYRDRYQGRWDPDPQLTYLFEIVYPSNRVVCDYQGLDDLVLLGAVAIESGKSNSPRLIAGEDDWPGPVVRTFPHATLAAALAAPTRHGAEGLVVRYTDRRDVIVKLKQPDYVAMHRVLTCTSAHTLWSYLAVNACKHIIADPLHWGTYVGLDPARAAEVIAVGEDWLDDVLGGVPDEFYEWVQATVDRLRGEVAATMTDAAGELRALRTVKDRRAAFRQVENHPLRTELMRAVSGGSETFFVLRAWREAQPGPETPFARGEDVA